MVYLKNGSIIHGVIIEQIPNVHIKIQSGSNLFVYKIDVIEKITKELTQNKSSIYSSDNKNEISSLTKGAKSISGVVSYTTASNDGDDTFTSLSINPSIGYFLTNNFSAHIGLIFSSYSTEQWDYSSSDRGFNFGGRFYTPVAFGLSYFGLHYSAYTTKTEWGDGDSDKSTSNSFSIRGGVLQGLNDFVYLDYGIRYYKGIGDNKNANLSFSIGVTSFIK